MNLNKMLDPLGAMDGKAGEYAEYLKTSMKDPTRMGLDADYRDKGMFGKMARADDEQAAKQQVITADQQYAQSMADMGAAAVAGSGSAMDFNTYYADQLRGLK